MQELTRDTFESFIGSETPTVVDFWAEWCMPCKVFQPVLEDLSKDFDGQIAFAKINIDDFGEYAQRYEIASIPTIIAFKGGQPVGQMVGVRPKQAVADALQKLL
ncbi:MAG: thioredoxin [Oscillospiraceae bacterium]|nr:thioredoxin [Oscillospiraceae bacterium]